MKNVSSSHIKVSVVDVNAVEAHPEFIIATGDILTNGYFDLYCFLPHGIFEFRHNRQKLQIRCGDNEP